MLPGGLPVRRWGSVRVYWKKIACVGGNISGNGMGGSQGSSGRIYWDSEVHLTGLLLYKFCKHWLGKGIWSVVESPMVGISPIYVPGSRWGDASTGSQYNPSETGRPGTSIPNYLFPRELYCIMRGHWPSHRRPSGTGGVPVQWLCADTKLIAFCWWILYINVYIHYKLNISFYVLFSQIDT